MSPTSTCGTVSSFRSGERDSQQQQQPRTSSRTRNRTTPIRLGKSSSISLHHVSSFDGKGAGDNGVWLTSHKCASTAEATVDPVLGNVLDTYWTEYANNFAAMQKKREREREREAGANANTRGSSHRNTSTRRGGKTKFESSAASSLPKTTTQRWKEMHAAHELDGLRYIESVSKLCCASTTPLPSDVYEKLLQILEHHEDHHHLCHLSLEAYALLTRLTAQYPCVTLSTEKLDGKKHIMVDPKAWTPLSLHRKLEDAEKEDIAEE